MGRIKVALMDHVRGTKTQVEMPDDVPLNRLIPALVRRLGLPTEQGGTPVTYRLDRRDTGERLGDEETLGSAGIRANETLALFPEVTAGCFLGDVRIALANGGTKLIRELQVGDHLVSGMPNSKKLTDATVVKVFRNTSKTYLTINESLHVTDSHPVCSNGEWVPASRLRVGDHLQDTHNNRVVIESIDRQYGNFEIYNLYVSSPEHTFFAEGFLVHNMAFKEAMTTQKNHAYSNPLTPSTEVNYDVLSIGISLSSSITLNEFFDNVTDRMQAIEFIYSIFALMASNDNGTISNFIKTIEQQGAQLPSNIYVHKFLTIANVEPLRIQSIHYGSPVTFDLLGVGNVLEIVRETIKDLAWRADHEKAMAELELKNKQVEIHKNKLETENLSNSQRLDLEKSALEIESQRIQIEKANTELLLQKLEIISKVTNLQLSDDDKKVIVSTLLPKALIITNNPVTPLPKAPDPYQLLFSRKE